jgi:hypothetical protein
MSVLFKTLMVWARTIEHMSEHELRALPNIGPAIARKLQQLGVERPDDLRGQDPERLFQRLCELDDRRHDPCLLDTFVAAVDHVNGAPPRPWWYYSRLRKSQDMPNARREADLASVHER